MRSGDGEGTYRPAEAEAAAWEEREGEDTEVSEGKAFNSGMRKGEAKSGVVQLG